MIKPIFIIQDINTKEYFWRYRIDEGFSSEISNATTFNSMEDACATIQDVYYADLFDKRYLEIRLIFNNN